MYVPIYTGNSGNSGEITQPGKTRTVRCSVKENPDRPVFGKNETGTARNPEKQVFAHHYVCLCIWNMDEQLYVRRWEVRSGTEG